MTTPSTNPKTGLGLNHRLLVRDPNASGMAANWGDASLSELKALLSIGIADTTPPVISTNAAFAVAENTLFSVALTADKLVSWSIVPGTPSPDFAAYVINGNILSFSASLNVDYENPDDKDKNNSYVVTVKATDIVGNSSTKQITTTVLDAVELFPPQNVSPPVLTGTAQQGQTLTVSSGLWSDTPSSYIYQWRRNGVPITGAQGSSYALTAEDVGATISVVVTAANIAGTGSENSGDSGSVTPAAPVNTVQPAISGTVQVGQTLTASDGVWTNNPTGYARQWKRNGSNIEFATGATYVPVTADIGAAITCTVTATNAGGSTPRTTAPTAPVIAAGSALAISGTPVTSGTTNVVFSSFTVSAAGGTGPYTFSVFAGALPTGISLNASTGLVSGTPTVVQTQAGIVIRVTDSAGAHVDLAAFQIAVVAAVQPPAISGIPGQATVGTPYSFTPVVTGGSGTRSFTLQGSLPAGLSFSSSTGAITGTPTTVSTNPDIQISVTDSVGTAILSGLTISVKAAGGFLLDSLSASPVGAYSLRKLRSAYSGFCIRVRRADGLEADFGFDSSGIVDTNEILNFTGRVSASAGYIVTWYDQSTLGNNGTQTNQTAQCQIVVAGQILMANARPIINQANQQGLNFAFNGGPLARSIRAVVLHGGSTNGDLLRASANNGFHVRFNGSHNVQLLKQGAGVIIATSAVALGASVLSTIAVDYDRNTYSIAVDGGTPTTGTSIQTFDSALTSLTGQSSTSALRVAAFLVFDTVISQADSDKIQQSVKAYYATA